MEFAGKHNALCLAQKLEGPSLIRSAETQRHDDREIYLKQTTLSKKCSNPTARGCRIERTHLLQEMVLK
jgi:hypothetical protein